MSPEPSTKMAATAWDELCINALRFLSVDAVQKANSGHPRLPLGADGSRHQPLEQLALI